MFLLLQNCVLYMHSLYMVQLTHASAAELHGLSSTSNYNPSYILAFSGTIAIVTSCSTTHCCSVALLQCRSVAVS